MERTDRIQDTETLIRRIELLERLCQSSAHVRDLVDDTGQSRATINRAINDLEEVGLIERGEGGVAVSVTGRLVHERFDAFLSEFDGILGAGSVLDQLSGAAIDPEVVAHSETILADEPAPYRPVERRLDSLAGADSYSAIVPTLDDPRQVRVLYEHVVTDGKPAELVVTPAVFETFRQEFPRRMAAMATTSGFSVSVGATPQFGLDLFDRHADGSAETATTTVHLVVFTERGTVHGVLVTDEQAAVRWARDQFEAAQREANDRTDALVADTDGGVTHGGGGQFEPIGKPLPISLEREGFVRVDSSYFRNEPVADPTTAWRAGLSLAEVHTGYAIGRARPTADDCDPATSTRTDDAEQTGAPGSLVSELTDGLARGDSRVVLGPPGSGKSTTCKQIACNWYEADRGPVYYRSGDRGHPLSSVDELVATATRADGHALIVVEDAVRPNAEAVFEAIDALDGHDDVSVLLDAREREWRDRTESAATDLAVTHVPPLDESDCERLVDHFERTVGRAVDVPAEQLWSAVNDEMASGAEGGSHELLRLMHRLATYADPLSDGATALEDAVAEVYAELADDELVLSVGILVNALNAAGIGVRRPLLYAVADDEFRYEAGQDTRATDLDGVDDALDRLDGHVVFGREDGRYRTVHEEWSTAFLKRLIDAEGEEAAARRFCNVVSALLALADDPARCERIATHVGEGWTLAAAGEDPQQWANETVEAVYALGTDRAQLAPLFGDDAGGSIELPAACSDRIAVRRQLWLGELFLAGDYYDRAERAFEHVPEEPAEVAAERLLGLGRVATHRGEYDDAIGHYRACLDLMDEEGDALLGARARVRLGTVLVERGEYADAEAHYETALNEFRARDVRGWEARTRHRIGNVAIKRGEFDRAREHYEASLELRQTLGDRQGEAETLNSIGNIAWKQGRIDEAAELFERTLERRRELGDRAGVASALNNLGAIAGRRGNYDRAGAFYEQSLERRRELGDSPGIAKSLHNLGHLETQRMNFDRATEFYERSLECKEALGDRTRLASTLNNLGTIEGRRGNYDRAAELHRRTLERREALGDRYGEAKSRHNLGQIELRHGNFDRAREFYEQCLELTEELDDRPVMTSALNNLGLIATQRGHPDRGREYSERALDIATEIDDRDQIAASYLCLGEISLRAAAYDRAHKHLEAASDAVTDETGLIPTRVQLAQARLALARGEDADAQQIANAVRESADEMQLTYWVARTDRLLGRIEFERGDDDTARDLLLDALDTFESIDAFHDALVTLEALVDLDGEDDDTVGKYHGRARELLADADDEVVDRHAAWLSDGQ